MEPKDYIVTKIEGEYAHLQLVNASAEDTLFIALALLPPGTDVGTKLHWEMFEYSIME